MCSKNLADVFSFISDTKLHTCTLFPLLLQWRLINVSEVYFFFLMFLQLISAVWQIWEDQRPWKMQSILNPLRSHTQGWNAHQKNYGDQWNVFSQLWKPCCRGKQVLKTFKRKCYHSGKKDLKVLCPLLLKSPLTLRSCYVCFSFFLGFIRGDATNVKENELTSSDDTTSLYGEIKCSRNRCVF